MDQLQITLAQVTQTAASIRSQNQQLNSCLQEIGTSMNQLAAYCDLRLQKNKDPLSRNAASF